MRRRQKFDELPVTCRKGTTAEGGQLGVGKAVKSAVDGSGRPVDTPTAGQLPSLVSYCLNRRHRKKAPLPTKKKTFFTRHSPPLLLFRPLPASLPPVGRSASAYSPGSNRCPPAAPPVPRPLTPSAPSPQRGTETFPLPAGPFAGKPTLSTPSELEERAQRKTGVDALLHCAFPLSFARELDRLRKLSSRVILTVNRPPRRFTVTGVRLPHAHIAPVHIARGVSRRARFRPSAPPAAVTVVVYPLLH